MDEGTFSLQAKVVFKTQFRVRFIPNRKAPGQSILVLPSELCEILRFIAGCKKLHTSPPCRSPRPCSSPANCLLQPSTLSHLGTHIAGGLVQEVPRATSSVFSLEATSTSTVTFIPVIQGQSLRVERYFRGRASHVCLRYFSTKTQGAFKQCLGGWLP